jgi:CRP-like cAMP-binding protein
MTYGSKVELTSQATISRVPFFQTLSHADIAALLQVTHTRAYSPGDIIFYKGDAGDGLYSLLVGKLNIYLPATNHTPKTSLKKVLPGECFGEFSLFDGEPRSASVEAVGNSEVLFLPTPAFAALLDARPSVAQSVVNHLGKTLLGHPKAVLSDFERNLIVKSEIPPTLKFIKIFCRLLRDANKRLSASH